MRNEDFKTRDWYCELDERTTDFARHPIKASDLIYTRDTAYFHELWNNFISDCSGLLRDYLQLAVDTGDELYLKGAREIVSFVEDTIWTIRGYERATGLHLIHHRRIDGRLRLHLSALNLLRS